VSGEGSEAVRFYQNKGSSTVEESMGPILVKLVAKDIVLRFIIEYSSLRDFGP